MRLLVTGGAGFIGSNFLRLLHNNTLLGINEVTVLDKLTYAGLKSNVDEFKNYKNFEFVHGDICDQDTVEQALKGIDAVVNFAAESHVDRSINDASQFVHTNVLGVQVILEKIRKTKRDVRFLQVSTDEVYGSISSGSWDEDCPLLPNSPYSASKASGELIARSYFRTHGLDVVTTRSSNNYGPFHFPEKLIPLFITNLIEGKKVPIYGTGENVRDWLHVEDHCRGLYEVLIKGRPGEIYNIGGGEELTNKQITLKILNQMGFDENYIEYVPDRLGHDLRYSVDSQKIQNELGFRPLIDFDLGLGLTINWFIENENWWRLLKQ
jgi:dTDP-glucose 4,6-dehydratase